ncbi:MAG: alpha/beta hydrolase [Lachnospiraceae bacterium]|nr:alpha/beta hydrolase [Lachnospiraceae bacterium]
MCIAVVIIGCRNFNYIDSYINNDKGVNEGTYVSLGGQEQYLLIQGEDTANPVIIWLHGGPAGPESFVNYTFQKHLAEDYTFINWDQRGCGRTYFHNADKDASNETVSFEQAQADLDALVDYACNRFHVEKVIIVGHSYGTMLGSQYVLNHPEKVLAYVGVGQVVTMESDIYSYEDALAKAIALGDDTQEMEAVYQKYMEDRSLVTMMDLRNYTSEYHVAKKAANTIWEGITSPYMGVDDVRWFLKQAGNLEEYLSLNKQLFDYITAADVRDYGLAYQVPVGFITGSDDWTTPSKYVEDYYNAINAPQKQFFLLEECGHTPQFDSPVEFCSILKKMLDMKPD